MSNIGDVKIGKKAAATRKRITDAALKLLNEKGTDCVNTHDIAHACNLSPGNLYYHFKNKEEIILAIIEGVDLFSPAKWKELGVSQEEGSFYKFIQFFFTELRAYRFFFREQSQLIRSDKKLAEFWKHAYSDLMDTMVATAEHWVEIGILKNFSSQTEIRAFIANSWIIMSYGHLFFATLGARQKQSDKELLQQLFSFLLPYHTEKGKRLLERYSLSI